MREMKPNNAQVTRGLGREEDLKRWERGEVPSGTEKDHQDLR